jgi:GNAT superfamily N-acetyltransferase
MKLRPIDAQAYAREVLPQTAALWAGRRTFDEYVADVTAVAESGYGRRHYRTFGFYDGDSLLASFKRYERNLHVGNARLRAIGIGAVFTPETLRGRGYASAMLAGALDLARADGYDAAFLFSDIHPAFYEALGFTALPSRSFSLRADGVPANGLRDAGLHVERLESSDWTGVRRCFELGERTRPWGFVRSPLVWEWVRMRVEQRFERTRGEIVNLVVRRGRGIAAYVLGVRDLAADAYILDEFGFADAQAAALVPSLLRGAAADLHRIVGWLPPAFARERLPRASVRKRSEGIFMAAPLSPAGKRWLSTATMSSPGDGIWITDRI